MKADSHQSWKTQRMDYPLEPSEGVQVCQHHDFELIISRTVREYISVI